MGAPRRKKKIISLKSNYFSTYVFIFWKKPIDSFFFNLLIVCDFFLWKIVKKEKEKRPVVVHPEHIFLYFNNHLNYPKAKNLHSFYLARLIRYIFSLIKGHNNSYKCHCFKCLVCRILIGVLFSRGHKKLFTIVANSNYLFITNKSIYDCLKYIK